MRILTVRQPWAWAIIHGGKNVENRVRNIAGDYRGPVLIHVAKAFDESAFEPEHPMHGLVFGACPRSGPDHNRYICDWCTKIAPARYGNAGEIIGVVDLVDVHRPLWDGSCGEGADAPCSPWAETDGWPHHLVLENPRALAEPIPYRGALGLRSTQFEVIGDWLAELTDKHNCAGGGYGEPHEDLCGFEPVSRLVATS